MERFTALSKEHGAPYLAAALVCATASFVIGFFLAGAIGFPLAHPYYQVRAWATLGLMYGIESIVRLGRIETCGFLSGNCSEHTVRSLGFTLWGVFFIVFFVAFVALRARRQAGRTR